MKFHIQKASKVVAVSEYIKNFAVTYFDYKKNISVIYNGLSINDSITYVGEKNTKTVVYAGRIGAKKGVINLIKAWPNVIKQFPDAKLRLYGEKEKDTTSIINSLLANSASSSIEFMGFIKKEALLNVYAKASCAIFPSYIEPFGMAPVEAMSVGCPVIFTKRATGKEIIKEGVDGLLVDPDDVNEIAEAIKLMLSERVFAEQMGKNGAIRVRDEFHISKIANDHIKLYHSFTNQTNTA